MSDNIRDDNGPKLVGAFWDTPAGRELRTAFPGKVTVRAVKPDEGCILSDAACRWYEWEDGDQAAPEPPYPFEWMTEQDRSEHMEATAYALVKAALDVSAPLSEVLRAVREMYKIRKESK
jgi:hypothetical protein